MKFPAVDAAPLNVHVSPSGTQQRCVYAVAVHAEGVECTRVDEPRRLQEAEAAGSGHDDGEQRPHDAHCCRHADVCHMTPDTKKWDILLSRPKSVLERPAHR